MKSKKKAIASIAMAFILLAGTSLAIFTDRQEASVHGQAGSVRLGEIAKPSVDLTKMRPGESRKFTLNSKYTGSLDAKGTVTIIDNKSNDNGKMHNSGKDGFVLKNGSEIIQFTNGKATIDKGKLQKDDVMKQEFVLELGADAPDTMQNAEVDLNFIFEAVQYD